MIEPFSWPWNPARFRCIDCGVNTSQSDGIGEYYSLRYEVWPLAVDEGMLCIGCVEKRIGRELTRGDFDLEAPLNHPDLWPGMLYSRRLLNRLGRKA